MKAIIFLHVLLCLLVLNACVQPVPGVKVSIKKVSIKLSPPPPLDDVPMQMAPDAELKDIKYLVGDTVSTKGVVYGHKNSGDTTLVYLGAAYPNQQLTVLLTGDAKSAFGNMDKKLIYVVGCVAKHKGILRIVVTDTDHFGLKYLYGKPRAK